MTNYFFDVFGQLPHFDVKSRPSIEEVIFRVSWLWRWLCENASHHQQSSSGLLVPGRSNSIEVCNSWVQNISYLNSPCRWNNWSEGGDGKKRDPGNKVVVETFNDSLKMLCLISTARVMAIGTKRRLLFSECFCLNGTALNHLIGGVILKYWTCFHGLILCIIEWNSQKTFFFFVLCTNEAGMCSCSNRRHEDVVVLWHLSRKITS